ncbi:MAG: ADP-ribosylglycohydrolase family protein [Bryobacteraceae bacterium]|nr:ADP-ribosylglycohydrolase family protein [Bryobacteraceae bacterium]
MTRNLFLTALLTITLASAESRKIAVSDYREKVYASWLAQCVANIYGLPHENQYIENPGPDQFPLGNSNAAQLRKHNGAYSDDDTDFEYMYLLAMEKFGPEPTYEQLAGLWKHHVRNRVWLANRAALGFIHHGFTPPATGWKQINPHWFQIDPQLVNEIWAVTAPGMVRYAAAKSGWAAEITDSDYGIEPTIHYGAMYAAAFFETDVTKLIDIGNAALPRGSRFRATVEDMKALYRKYPNDWKAARQAMAKRYYHNEPASTKTIWNANLNGAAGILALLYGRGDFQRTLDLSCSIGFDADNQAATMSGLLGVVHGLKGIPRDLLFPFPDLDWKEPLNDSYKNVTRHDMPDGSLKDMAARMAEQGERIILKHGGRRIVENGQDYYVINSGATFAPPLEIPAQPAPLIEVGLPARHPFAIVGPKSAASGITGNLPEGLTAKGLTLSGKASKPGVYPVTLTTRSGEASAQRDFTLVVRPENLAPKAERVLAGVPKTDDRFAKMRITVSRSIYASDVEVIRDGRSLGDGTAFVSVGPAKEPKTDFYGYEWKSEQEIGLIGFHTGVMEETGGWFKDLRVEYLDRAGNWQTVPGASMTPALPGGNSPYDKPHFAEYLIAFPAVRTTAIRIIGEAGGSEHFTSISELRVYGPLPRGRGSETEPRASASGLGI